MDDIDRQPGAGHNSDAAPDADSVAYPDMTAPLSSGQSSDDDTETPGFEESLVEEFSALIDDGRNYATAEIQFQKTRGKLAGRSVGIAVVSVIVGLILLHIAFLALAVGLVIALAPLVTIWGSIVIVFGGILLIVCLLGWLGFKRVRKAASLFSSGKEGVGS